MEIKTGIAILEYMLYFCKKRNMKIKYLKFLLIVLVITTSSCGQSVSRTSTPVTAGNREEKAVQTLKNFIQRTFRTATVPLEMGKLRLQ
jgi:hypothetical protein